MTISSATVLHDHVHRTTCLQSEPNSHQMFPVHVQRVQTRLSELTPVELSARTLCIRVDLWRHHGGMSCACPGGHHSLTCSSSNQAQDFIGFRRVCLKILVRLTQLDRGLLSMLSCSWHPDFAIPSCHGIMDRPFNQVDDSCVAEAHLSSWTSSCVHVTWLLPVWLVIVHPFRTLRRPFAP